jgi:DNA-binding FadR family transcriptional regulator
LHRTDADLTRLEEANESLASSGSIDQFLQANVDWHVAVATASNNEILAGIMIALSRAIYTTTNTEGFVGDEIRAATVRAHRSVTRAIQDRDPDAAVRRMNRHVHTYAAAVLAVDQRTAITVNED